MNEWLTGLLSEHGPFLLYTMTFLVLVICGLGVPFPEEATFLCAGWACAKVPEASVLILCVVGVFGIMAGDSVPYWMGRKHGMKLLQGRFFSRFLKPTMLKRVKGFFDKHGSKTVFVARFVAGLRMPAFFMSGAMGIRYRTFFLYDLAGALISCPTSIWVAWKFGPDAERLIKENHKYLFIFLGVVVAYIIYHIVTHRSAPEDAAAEAAAAAEMNSLPQQTPEPAGVASSETQAK